MRIFGLILCLAFTCFSFAQEAEEDDAAESSSPQTVSSPPAQTAAEEPSTVSEIVVTARFNFCDPEIMKRRLPSADGLLTNWVNPPGWQLESSVPTKNPNFFDAGFRSAHVKDIIYADQKLTLFASYMSCQTAKCDSIVSSATQLTLVREMRYGWDDDSIARHYTVSGEVEFSQMYDAKHENVEVPCPVGSCQGIIFYGPKSRNFYTATRVGDRIERKLVVNGGLDSRFVDKPTGSTLERCPAVEPPVAVQNQSRRHR